MRLWSLHPRYLDPQGLVACWREALLAQKVLAGLTTGYRHHPQLTRFRGAPDPAAAIGSYLTGLADEADERGYHFDRARIAHPGQAATLPVTVGQLEYERDHLLAKLRVRRPDAVARLSANGPLATHPLFVARPGPIEPWEITGR